MWRTYGWLKTARNISEVHRLRSTQFEDPILIDEAPEEHLRQTQPSPCEALKRLGYSRNNQVRLYGQVFDLLSDPVKVSENLVFVDALERESGQLRRVRIPRAIIQMARMNGAQRRRKAPPRLLLINPHITH